MASLLKAIMLSLSAFVVANSPADAARRAFVVGIAEYDKITSLSNSVRDATAFKETLEILGYQVVLVPEHKNSRTALINEWNKFLRTIKQGDDVVIYFSGHVTLPL